MKFKKVNNKIIKCFISKDELNEYGVELEDLMCNRDKAEDFLDRLMMEARYELDFKITSQSLAVQINVMPSGDLALTIADKDDLVPLLEGLQGPKQCQCQNDSKTLDTDDGQVRKVNFDGPAWVEVNDLDIAITLSKNIAGGKFVMSQLYKYDGVYFIRFELDDNKDLGKIFISCAEYGDDLFLDKSGGTFIMEHGRCIIDEDAIFTLASV